MSRLLIVNPFATGVTDARIAAVRRELEPVTLAATRGPGHATELARDAGAVEAVYVFGGDGTFNEVLNGIDRRIPVGFLPGGGASVLPRALGLPRSPVGAARRLLRAEPRSISVGRVNGRRFSFSAGLGLDADAVRRIDALGRSKDGGRAGNAVFALMVVRLLLERRFRFEPALEIVGFGRASFVFVANGSPYTYLGPLPLRFVPRARFESGLDFVAPVAIRARSVPRLGLRAFSGRLPGARGVLAGHDLDRLEVRCDAPTALQADGEDLGDVEHAVFEVERDAVRVLV